MEKLRIDNPYHNGVIVDFGDNEPMLLDRSKPYQFSIKDRYHIVTNFDTLTDLSYTYYGNSKYFWLIAKANIMIDPFSLVPGSSIIIPDLANFKTSLK